MTDQRIDPRALTDAQLLQRFNLGSLSEEVDADTLGRIREWAGECSEADDADAAAADPSSAALKQRIEDSERLLRRFRSRGAEGLSPNANAEEIERWMDETPLSPVDHRIYYLVLLAVEEEEAGAR